MKMNVNMILAFAIFLTLGMIIGSEFKPDIIHLEKESAQPFYKSLVAVPAVDQEGKGVTVYLSVEARNGTGKTLTDIDKLLFWIDTQESIKAAKQVAENMTHKSTDGVDLLYSVEESHMSIVGGPSAGAAITLATISVLNQKELRKDVMITGTVMKNGTIGPVGSVYEKAAAAKEHGATLFLVPVNSSIDVKTTAVQSCNDTDGIEYCETKYAENSKNIGDELGIEVIEISTIQEAMPYMFY
jgi:uncharacterized protein